MSTARRSALCTSPYRTDTVAAQCIYGLIDPPIDLAVVRVSPGLAGDSVRPLRRRPNSARLGVALGRTRNKRDTARARFTESNTYYFRQIKCIV